MLFLFCTALMHHIFRLSKKTKNLPLSYASEKLHLISILLSYFLVRFKKPDVLSLTMRPKTQITPTNVQRIIGLTAVRRQQLLLCDMRALGLLSLLLSRMCALRELLYTLECSKARAHYIYIYSIFCRRLHR